jgi:hypothetical protein
MDVSCDVSQFFYYVTVVEGLTLNMYPYTIKFGLNIFLLFDLFSYIQIKAAYFEDQCVLFESLVLLFVFGTF